MDSGFCSHRQRMREEIRAVTTTAAMLKTALLLKAITSITAEPSILR